MLRQALGDDTLQLGFATSDGERMLDLAGAPLVTTGRAVPVLLGGERVGLVATARTSRELLREIASAAAPTVEVIRLRLGMRQALSEVEASRARLLRAGYEERERLERDLHDGAQLRLVSLGMSLRLAQRHLAAGDVDVNGLLDEAVAELGTAVSELRQLAHGIRPSCLDDGLAPALSVLVGNVPIPVEMDVAETQIDGDLQTTAYYVASEAIANAVKHSRARRIALRVVTHGTDVHVRVTDDGVGGAAQTRGIGPRAARRPGERARRPALRLESTGRRYERGGDPAVRVVIGEDSALFREGLARLLEDAGHEITAKAHDAPSLERAVDRELPDLAIVDVRMPPDMTDDGARAARRLRESHPQLGIVLLSQHVETQHSVELVASGRLRLPAEGPCVRRGRLHGRAPARRRGRIGARPGGRDAAAQSAARQRPARAADARAKARCSR